MIKDIQMKWIFSLGLWMIFGLSYACELVFVSLDNPNTVLMASNIASGLFFKSNCARTIEKTREKIEKETEVLLSAWNLCPTQTINLLTQQDVIQARLILVLTATEKKQLDTLYPLYRHKIHVMSECARIAPVSQKNSVRQVREHLFRAENVISANGWKCMKKGL